MVKDENQASSDQEWEESDVDEPRLITFDVNALRHAVRGAEEPSKFVYTGSPYNMSFKMIKSDSRLVKSLLFSYGFIQCSNKNPNFNLCWSNTHLNPNALRIMKSYQRVNHFPRSFLITKKDQLHTHVSRARANYGAKIFDFIPESYCTPINEEKRERLKKVLKTAKNEILIVKPSNSSRGRGITFVNQPNQIDEILDTDNVVISRYIANPYLIQNKKSDLRIYVAVTSFFPLIAYMFSDGLTRFAVDDYSDDLTGVSAQAQLTNYSLHKTNEKFVKNDRVDCEDVGNKWTLSAMLRHMKELGVDTELLMLRIEDVVIKTLLSIQKLVGVSARKLSLHPNNCFELFGFDILIDDNLKPWLLEVNLSPSLNCDAPVDSIIKSELLATTLNLAGIPLVAEKNTLNKAYILTRFSPSLDEISDGVSNVATIHDNKDQSASVSPATVDSGYDTRSLASDSSSITRQMYSRISPPRKKTSMKAAKQRRAQQQLRITRSPEKLVKNYNSRLEILAKKVRDEEKRMGDFIRIFPRQESRSIYGQICEDSGPELWDVHLANALYGKLTNQITQRDYEQFHEQMADAGQYKSRTLLSECTSDLLKSAFKTASKYEVPFYQDDSDPFPQMLPKLRFGLRKRTLSAIDFDFKRKAEIVSKRECGSVEGDLTELKQMLYEQYKSESGTPRLIT